MPLEITRNFVENRDGTFDLYEIPKVQVENIDDSFKGKTQTPIRPFELKTFLKVGKSPGQLYIICASYMTGMEGYWQHICQHDH